MWNENVSTTSFTKHMRVIICCNKSIFAFAKSVFIDNCKKKLYKQPLINGWKVLWFLYILYNLKKENERYST